METAAVILGVLALVLALAAWVRAGAAATRAVEAELQARRRAENAAEETGEALDGLRRLLAAAVSGDPPTPDMILEGRLWRDLDGAAAHAWVGAGARVLDVRTAAEVAGGMLPEALWIPIESLEERVSELPRDARSWLVVCAGGARSAAACEFLAQRGYSGLGNLEGGIGTWPGDLVRPS
jgi:rhodanese-related sulfurtransferase